MAGDAGMGAARSQQQATNCGGVAAGEEERSSIVVRTLGVVLGYLQEYSI